MRPDPLVQTYQHLNALVADEVGAVGPRLLAVALVRRAAVLVESDQANRSALAFTLARLARELDADALQAERLH